MTDLRGRSFLTLLDYTPEEILYLLDLADKLKADKKQGITHDPPTYKQVLGRGQPNAGAVVECVEGALRIPDGGYLVVGVTTEHEGEVHLWVAITNHIRHRDGCDAHGTIR